MQFNGFTSDLSLEHTVYVSHVFHEWIKDLPCEMVWRRQFSESLQPVIFYLRNTFACSKEFIRFHSWNPWAYWSLDRESLPKLCLRLDSKSQLKNRIGRSKFVSTVLEVLEERKNLEWGLVSVTILTLHASFHLYRSVNCG